MKINLDKCEVNKRRLVFDCEVNGKNYHFEYDDWDRNDESKTIGGTVIKAYRHCVQAYILTAEEGCIFIDRQYKHNYSYEVYFNGVVYTVGDESQPNLIGVPKPAPTKTDEQTDV